MCQQQAVAFLSLTYCKNALSVLPRQLAEVCKLFLGVVYPSTPFFFNDLSPSMCSSFGSLFSTLQEYELSPLISLQCAADGKPVASKNAESCVQSIWALLPPVCNYPVDTAKSFSLIAKALGDALTKEPELRGLICSSLKVLTTYFQVIWFMGNLFCTWNRQTWLPNPFAGVFSHFEAFSCTSPVAITIAEVDSLSLVVVFLYLVAPSSSLCSSSSAS